MIQIIGFALIAWSFVMLVKMCRTTPSVVFDFEDGTYEFDIESPGFYSIAVLGAGFVGKFEQVRVQVEDENGSTEVEPYIIALRVSKGAQMATGCWYFKAETPGHYRLSISNLGAVEAKSSMLPSKRIFQSPLDRRELNILIHKSIAPLHQVFIIIGFVIGFGVNIFILVFFSV